MAAMDATEHIKEIMETGCFTRYQMVKLLETDEEEGATYAIQYYAENMKRTKDI